MNSYLLQLNISHLGFGLRIDVIQVPNCKWTMKSWSTIQSPWLDSHPSHIHITFFLTKRLPSLIPTHKIHRIVQFIHRCYSKLPSIYLFKHHKHSVASGITSLTSNHLKIPICGASWRSDEFYWIQCDFDVNASI